MWENAQAIELWIKNLGKSHSSLVQENLIPALPLKRLYDESNSLGIEPCAGIELNFWFETQRFEEIVISLIAQDPKLPAYGGTLPSPFDTFENDVDVHAEFGEPYKSEPPASWMHGGVTLTTGAWEFYELDEGVYSGCRIEVHYSPEYKVATLCFSVFDKES